MDREKVINGLNDIGGFIAGRIGIEQARNFLRTIDDAIDLLKEQEEHKTGKWEVKPSNKEQGERDFIWWKCSECGQVIYSESEHDREEFHKYCGRCGAKMT